MQLENKSYVTGATQLRGFACLWVLGMHAIAAIFPEKYLFIRGSGKIGVWLFFVLSSFLITLKFEQDKFTTSTILSYIGRRFFKIYPPFLISVFFYRFFGTSAISSYEDVKSAIFMQKGYDHLWTIPVEFKAYFFIPVASYIFITIKETFGLKATWALLVFAIVLHHVFYPYFLLPENSIYSIWYAPSFLIGSVGALSFGEFEKFLLSANEMGAVISNCIIIVSLTVIILMMPFSIHYMFKTDSTDFLVNKYLPLSFLWIAILLSIATNVGSISKFFISNFPAVLGTCSYSIYLIHWYFVNTFKEWNIKPLAFISSVFFSIILGIVFYYTIEKLSERLRRFIFDCIIFIFSKYRFFYNR